MLDRGGVRQTGKLMSTGRKAAAAVGSAVATEDGNGRGRRVRIPVRL
jgi:hypothetical protein